MDLLHIKISILVSVGTIEQINEFQKKLQSENVKSVVCIGLFCNVNR